MQILDSIMDANKKEKESLPNSGKAAASLDRRHLIAHVAPFACFMLLLALSGGISKFAQDLVEGPFAFWLVQAEYWIYPLQAIGCLAVIGYFWKEYTFRWSKGLVPALVVGLVVLLIWIAPQLLFGASPRQEGFDPSVFQSNPAGYWLTVTLRFLRMVIAVPLLEEIFWRGFLLRYLINEDFSKVPFGKFSWLSFAGVTLMFGLAHAGPDFWVAILTGILYNGLACLTRSLGACVIAHALTNLLLGIYIMETRQWGFW